MRIHIATALCEFVLEAGIQTFVKVIIFRVSTESGLALSLIQNLAN